MLKGTRLGICRDIIAKKETEGRPGGRGNEEGVTLPRSSRPSSMMHPTPFRELAPCSHHHHRLGGIGGPGGNRSLVGTAGK